MSQPEAIFRKEAGSRRLTAGFQSLIRVRIEHLWMGLPILATLLRGMMFPLPLYDFWWHLKLGELIVTTGSIPRTDIFSYTTFGKTFVVQNWLSEVLFYLVYLGGGPQLLIALNAALLVAVLLPVYALCLRSTENLRLSACIAILTSVTFFGYPRPQVFSFVLFSVFYLILEEYRLKRSDHVLMLPLLMAAWVNLHGAFVMGLGLTGLYLGTETVRRFALPATQRVLSPAKLGKLGAALGLSAVATLANPETYRVYAYVRTVISDQASQKFVAEWQPPVISSFQGFFLFYGLFFACLVTLFYSRSRLELTELILFTGFSAFALSATRNTMWFTIVATPILARHLNSIFAGISQTETHTWLGKIRRKMAERSRASGPLYGLNFTLVCLACLALVANSPWLTPRLTNATLLDSQTPVGAVDYIEKHRIKDRIFHPQAYGDYLIWRLWPDQKSFIDSRVHAFSKGFVSDYLTLSYDSRWEDKLEKYKVRFLLLSKVTDRESESEREIKNQAQKSKKWQVIYEDELAVLYRKR